MEATIYNAFHNECKLDLNDLVMNIVLGKLIFRTPCDIDLAHVTQYLTLESVAQ